MAKVIDATLKLVDSFTPVLRNVNTALKNTSNVTNSVKSHLGNLKSKMNECEKGVTRLGKSFTTSGKQMASLQNIAVLGALTAAAQKGYEASKEINGAVNQMRIWGELTPEIANKIKKGIIEVSNQYGIAANDVASATQLAIKMGVKESEAIEYMSNAAKYARVTKIDLGEATKQLTNISHAYWLTTKDTEAAENQLIYTSRQYKIDIQQLSAGVSDMSGKAAQLGIDLVNLQATMAITKGAGYTDTQSIEITNKMIESLGKAQDKLKGYGVDMSQARITTEGLAPVLKDLQNAMGAEDFTKLFKGADAKTMANMLISDAGVSDFKKKMQEIKGSSANVMQEMWKQMQTPSEQTQQALVQLANAWITVGDALAPIFKKSAMAIKSLVDTYNGLTPTQQGFISTAIQIAVVITAAVVAFGGLFSIIGGGIAGFLQLKTVFSSIFTGIKLLKIAMMGLSFNPWILAIAAIIVIIYLLYTHWDMVVKYFKIGINLIKGYFAGLVTIITGIVNLIKSIFMIFVHSIYNNFMIIFNGIKQIFNGFIQFITAVFAGDLDGALAGLSAMFEGWAGIVTGVFDNIKSTCLSVVNTIVDAVNSINFTVPDWVPGYGGQTFSPNLPHFAKGTDNFAGGNAVINEKGGEIVNLPNHTQVIPHDKSLQQEYARGRKDGNIKNNGVNIVIQNMTVRQDSDIDRIANLLAEKINLTAQNLVY